jgi:hypothetical protein
MSALLPRSLQGRGCPHSGSWLRRMKRNKRYNVCCAATNSEMQVQLKKAAAWLSKCEVEHRCWWR